MPHLDAASLVCDAFTLDSVEHERPGVVRKAFLACGRSALHALPVHLLLGVDAADDVLVRSYELRDCLSAEADVSVDEHEVVMSSLKKHPHKLVACTGDEALVSQVAP